jgi:hypothetical protein
MKKWLHEHRKAAPGIDRIYEFLDGAHKDAAESPCSCDAETWREWLESVMRDWAGQASRFEYLAEKGPMVDGVVKGMKEIREQEDDMEKREIENAKDEVREPVAYSGFPSGMTHVQQVNECLG